jgi:hypothetical protein
LLGEHVMFYSNGEQTLETSNYQSGVYKKLNHSIINNSDKDLYNKDIL